MRPTQYQTAEERTQARVQYNRRHYAKRKAQQIYSDLPPGPYRVLYADPPWTYNERDPTYRGHAADRYPPLSLAELCALPVKRILAPKAVLFLWVTAPQLAACWPVMQAWGFTYRSQVIWWKHRHNYGHYFSVQHENLLLCTRGSYRPTTHLLPPSVWEPEPEEHSVKPDTFRRLIEGMYADGPRLELFARTRVEGWDCWGNQVD